MALDALTTTTNPTDLLKEQHQEKEEEILYLEGCAKKKRTKNVDVSNSSDPPNRDGIMGSPNGNLFGDPI
ncbi:hypothetical protein QJS10_CPA09g00949 [Acorus calamus]|uniref:Uncharacterized protein n=1 Tax=Acorus calamus TaxID=4465 RepID=A0AAV9E9E9_ACOCL|nr:hypothetical protein QJS10_CPA09g00949 [Acorus calamus]